MVSSSKCLGYLTFVLNLLSGLISIGLALTIYARFLLNYLLFGIMGLVVAFGHIPVLTQPLDKRAYFLYLMIFGIIIGIGALLLNLSLLVPLLLFGGAVFGVIAYWMAGKTSL